MHKVRTPWPVATRISFIVAFEEACRRYPGISARRFCAVADVPYSTFARWWAHWQQEGTRLWAIAPGDRGVAPAPCRGRCWTSSGTLIGSWAGECAASMPI